MALKHFDNITSAQKSAKGVVALSDNPNKGGTYGVGGLSASELKAWFDKLVNYVIDRLNTLQTALGNKDASGVGSDYIRVDCSGLFDTDPDGGYCLSDIVSSLTDGKMASFLTASWDLSTDEDDDAVSATLQAILNDVAYQISTKGDASDLTALEGRMDDAEGDIDDLESDVADNTAAIGDINTELGAVDGRLDAIETKDTGYDNHVGNSDIHVTASDKSAWTAKYDKPSGGIPKSDMASAVQTSLGKADTALQAADIVAKADLVDGKVPSDQLPSYVDDVEEYASASAFPATGESGKIYVAKDTNKTYRWGGSAYTVISETLALGETSGTAYRGDRGKAAYDHSLVTSGNPHNVTKGDVGLSDVVNKGMDDAPVASSDKYVKSGGVHSAIDSAVSTAEGYADTKDAVIQGEIDSIKNGNTKVGHAKVADNLTPYSEDSGTTQEEPFISQGTGTDNNSVIVTTGVIARQLEKQGNTVVKNQLSQDYWTGVNNGITVTKSGDKAVLNGTPLEDSAYIRVADPSIPTISGHKYLLLYIPSVSLVLYDDSDVRQFSNLTTSSIFTSSGMTITPKIRVNNGTTLANATVFFKTVDLTQWFNGNDNIPADLLANPSHFSWYYNGSLAYDAGSLQNCNGRYLECGQGRNLFNKDTVTLNRVMLANGTTQSNNTMCYSGYILITPNKPIYVKNTGAIASVDLLIAFDQDKNAIGSVERIGTNGKLRMPFPNARYVVVNTLKTELNTQSVEIYYTTEEGGEGYGDMHDYVAPVRIDTGNESLRAFDKKPPNGVIERNTGKKKFKDMTWVYASGYGSFYSRVSDIKPFTNAYTAMPSTPMKSTREITSFDGKKSGSIFGWSGGGATYIYTYLPSASGDVTVLMASFRDEDEFEYELADASKTTEQGTPFSEYAPINDYSYMAWLDTDENLVSIPQGCKLFYPVDYKGFVDDLVMYTNGDATALAKNESITDAALNARGYYKLQDLLTAFGANGMVGGSLRQQLAQAKSIDFLNTLCVDLGNSDWEAFDGLNGVWRTNISNAYAPASSGDVADILCTKYQTDTTNRVSSRVTDMTIGLSGNGTTIYIYNTDLGSYRTPAYVKESMKGVLLAYRKAST